jgi:hypothetical protein
VSRFACHRTPKIAADETLRVGLNAPASSKGDD